jgi:hypothetical protein
LSASVPEPESEPIEAPPAGRARALARWAAVAWLGLQALVPLGYYLGDDLYDERFSWRMFSAVRMYECQMTVTETDASGPQPFDLRRSIHGAWAHAMQLNREAVIRRFLRWRCTQEGVVAVRVENRCREPDGGEVPLVRREIRCESGAIEADGGSR